MPKITHKKTADILQYRRNYYQYNKERISTYQKKYYRLKKGLPEDFKLNWRGEKITQLTRTFGTYIIRWD